MERKSHNKSGKKTCTHGIKIVKKVLSPCGMGSRKKPRSKYKVSEKAVHNPVPGRDEEQ